MPIYNHNGTFGHPVNISRFVTDVQNGVVAGPLPYLAGAGNDLGVNASAAQAIGPVPGITRAFGLITCAAVIYVSTDPNAVPAAWVNHSNAGHVSAADVAAALASLGGPPPASVLVIFAHPGASDPGYLASIGTIGASGIPANNIVEIPNLIVPQFGINNLAQIG
ncbi:MULTISPECIES: hypothetical protein [unclassified Xanthomonas]|uniref:hypothetical protein n=1 Tax=unclassified Xanthomonas TaxID=2643310 RepID=UPI002A841CD1|nr:MULTISPECIES: hypothetical protein [unclassified Xanthomonas]MDY4297563.1 hypothetical protein [Xanthomonas sp. LF02-5]MDY4359357.1 hypothetical protein [Xanthomonas sp. LF04-12]